MAATLTRVTLKPILQSELQNPRILSGLTGSARHSATSPITVILNWNPAAK